MYSRRMRTDRGSSHLGGGGGERGQVSIPPSDQTVADPPRPDTPLRPETHPTQSRDPPRPYTPTRPSDQSHEGAQEGDLRPQLWTEWQTRVKHNLPPYSECGR